MQSGQLLVDRFLGVAAGPLKGMLGVSVLDASDELGLLIGVRPAGLLFQAPYVASNAPGNVSLPRCHSAHPLHST